MKEYFINLFRYENQANKEVSECLLSADLPPEKALSLMSHIVNAQEIWLCRITGKAYDTNSVWMTISKSELKTALKNSSEAMTAYISSLQESDLEKNIEYSNIKGEAFTSRLKDIITHLLFHSAYHRGQVILLMKTVVNELPATDFIKFARDNDIKLNE